MKKVVLLFAIISIGVKAQVGINNPLPDTASVLDLSGPNNIGRGLLIPESGDLLTVPNTADGLLIRDTVTNEIYIRFETDAKWQSVNPWRQEYGTTNIYTIGKNVGIGTTTPTQLLDVSGNANVSGTFTATNVTASGTVTANDFVGDGVVPSGGIIMWSGTTPPTGWVLCDGKTYYKSTGAQYTGAIFMCPGGIGLPSTTITTPNLKGRFVMGYDPANVDYDNPGNYSTGTTCRSGGDVGGVETVTLTSAQSGLPAHSHTLSATASTAGAHTHTIPTTEATSAGTAHVKRRAPGTAGTITSSSAGSHTHTISGSAVANTAQNATQAHENRPPYYVLAYIMKL